MPLAILVALVLAGCEKPAHPKPANFQKVEFSELPQWQATNLNPALADFRLSCSHIARSKAQWHKWQQTCLKANNATNGKQFFESHFTAYRVGGDKPNGLFTAYYQPTYQARHTATPPFTAPIYEPPANLVRLNPADFGREGRTFYGEVQNNRLVPLSSRAEINQRGINSRVIGWLKPADAFFLAIQGSGILEFGDGKRLRARFAAKNGRLYKSIGKIYAQTYNRPPKSVTAKELMDFINAHPQQGKKLMEQNPSYVFFTGEAADKPLVGSLQVPLIAFRSMAVDLSHIPAYAPLWLVLEGKTQLGGLEVRLPRLMLAHDSGSAIRGLVRGDIFSGSNFAVASGLQNKGGYYLLLPNGYSN